VVRSERHGSAPNCFVALAQREISEEGPLTHWGEITHRKMAKKLKASPGAGVLSKLPDMAAILPAGGNAAVSLIIENKVILGGEKPEGTIENLKEPERLAPGSPSDPLGPRRFYASPDTKAPDRSLSAAQAF
jgi:hypothetical protein